VHLLQGQFRDVHREVRMACSDGHLSALAKFDLLADAESLNIACAPLVVGLETTEE
jgi:hypothetical protein